LSNFPRFYLCLFPQTKHNFLLQINGFWGMEIHGRTGNFC
jgi:hypothetical protein